MIDKEKSEIIGLLCAEGCNFVSISTYYEWDRNRKKYYLRKNKRCERIDFSNTDARLAEHFRNLLIKCYGSSPKYTSLKVMIVRKKMIRDLLSYSKFGWNKWAVPKEILNGPRSVKTAFIRGLYEGDGTKLNWRGKQPYIDFHMYNVGGLKKVRRMLEQLGIRSKLYESCTRLLMKGEDVEKFAKIIKPKYKSINMQGRRDTKALKRSG